MTYKFETSKFLDDMTGEVYQLCNVNAKTLITNVCQENNTIITEKNSFEQQLSKTAVHIFTV